MPAECCKKFWEKIPEDVPVFTLAGWDPLAIDAIITWIALAVEYGVPESKLIRSREHLKAIQQFQKDHPERVKMPD